MNHLYPYIQDGIRPEAGTNMQIFGTIFGTIFMFFFFVAILAFVIWLVMRSKTASSRFGSSSSKALEILDERFAKGEIDAAEYEERRKILRS